jgi:PAS domain S-box-containing protein
MPRHPYNAGHHLSDVLLRVTWLAIFCAISAPTLLRATSTSTDQASRRPQQKVEVLFLSSSDPDLPDVAAMIEQAEIRIMNGSDRPVHFSFEFLQRSSFADPSSQKTAESYLLQKYRGQTIDILVAINEETIAVAERTRKAISPDATLLFFVVNPRDPNSWLGHKPNSTGVIREVNYLPTLQLALRQNPGTAHVIVVSGSSDGEKADAKLAAEQFRSYEPHLNFRYLSELQFSELASALEHLPPDYIILFLDFVTDARGEQFIPARILPSISRSASRPIYGTFSSLVGAGAVGGSVADLGDVGRILGDDAVLVLKGKSPETIPVSTGDFQHFEVDWRQMRRWGFAENQLPKASEVRYWEYSPWLLYRWKILGLAAVLLIETILIGLLLRSIARYKRSKKLLFRKDKDLAEAQRLARVGSWLWDAKSNRLICSEELLRIHGLAPNAPIPSYDEFMRAFTPETREALNRTIEGMRRATTIQEVDLELLYAKGGKKWITARGEAVRNVSNEVTQIRGTVQDITDRKQEEEARFRLASIVESTDDAIVSKNPGGIIVSWNRGAEHMFGFAEGEVIGQPITILIPRSLWLEEDTISQKTRAGETIDHYETVRVTKEGKEIDVSLTVSPLRDTSGRIIGASEIARDITKQRSAELELKNSEERFSKAFRYSPMALSLVSAKTNLYLDVNESFERMWGYSRGDVVGKSALEIGLWANPNERTRLTLKLESEGSLREAECEWRGKDGRTRIALASIELVEINGEQCFLGVVSDITNRKQAEQALMESEKRFRLMANTAPVPIWTSGADGFRDYFNHSWLEFTGRSFEEEVGNGWLKFIHPEDVKEYNNTYSQAFNARKTFQVQFRLRRHDGQYRWLVDVAAPRFNPDRSFAGYIGSCTDITERKAAEELLATIGRKLIETQEQERKRIARELHDDINQRMALVANWLQTLEQRTPADLPLHKTELKNLWKLTNEISTAIEHVSHQLHPSKLHYLGLAAAIRSLCHECSLQYQIEIECAIQDVPDDLEESTSLALFRVVQESLRNVSKHSQARKVRVELTRRGKKIYLTVSDNGSGFKTDAVEQDPGLGLLSMRERLRIVDGEFSIESHPTLGTKVLGVVPVVLKTRQELSRAHNSPQVPQ